MVNTWFVIVSTWLVIVNTWFVLINTWLVIVNMACDCKHVACSCTHVARDCKRVAWIPCLVIEHVACRGQSAGRPAGLAWLARSGQSAVRPAGLACRPGSKVGSSDAGRCFLCYWRSGNRKISLRLREIKNGFPPHRNPLKPCRLFILLEPLLRKCSKKYQKSIRFFSKSWWRFTTLQTIKEPLVKQRFGAFKKVDQNTL